MSKSKLYKTAQLGDKFVRVVYSGTDTNHVTNISEPLYKCYLSLSDDSFIGTYFESSLTNFCL